MTLAAGRLGMAERMGQLPLRRADPAPALLTPAARLPLRRADAAPARAALRCAGHRQL